MHQQMTAAWDDSPSRAHTLDFEDTLALKGIAIVSIVLHNYYHLLGPVHENEFEFDPCRFTVFLQSVQDPRQTVQALFSFLGHYGVQIFIFLSAYGLAIRHWDTRTTWRDFMWSRVKKLYPMFFLAVLTWMLYEMTNPLKFIRENGGLLALTVLGVENLAPGVNLPPIGPWWFLPFIMQLYAMWPILKRIASRYGTGGLIALSCASLALVYGLNDTLVARWSINLLETPIGRMPGICLGIFAARSQVLPGRTVGLVGAAVLVGGNAYRPLWPLSFLAAALLALWLYRVVAPFLRRWALLHYLGVCSMALFFVNGFSRMPFLAIARQKTWVAVLLLGFASLVFAILLSQFLRATEGILRSAVLSARRWNTGREVH